MEITKEHTVAEVVSKNLGSDQVFSKYNIDFCCGGGATLDIACKESGVEFETLKTEIEGINERITKPSNSDDGTIGALTLKAIEVYLPQINSKIVELLPMASKIAEVHGSQHPELLKISSLLLSVEGAVKKLTDTFNGAIHPVIEELLRLEDSDSDSYVEYMNGLENTFTKNEISHQILVKAFKNINDLSSNYKLPDDVCSSYSFVYTNLKQLERDVKNYLHFETHILIPKSLKIIN